MSSSSPQSVNWKLIAATVLVGGGLFSLAKYLTRGTAAGKREGGQRKVIRLGTRTSQLALWQANYVAETLRKAYPDIDFQVVGMNTMGDVDQIKPLTEFDSKGVFTKELDIALLNDSIDIAVHCMKDLPTTLPQGLYMGSVLERGDTEDALVISKQHLAKGWKTLADLPAGSKIGTSALRRFASIKKQYPDLVCQNIRGNVNTRLMKLDRGDYDALLLARVGLKRLNFEDRINQVLDTNTYGYAVGQGALAVLCRENDPFVQGILTTLEHAPTRLACEAERGLLRKLQGGCKVPIAVRTTTVSTSPVPKLRVWSSVMSVNGERCVEATVEREVPTNDAACQLGNDLGETLLRDGAAEILAGIINPQGTGLEAPKKKN